MLNRAYQKQLDDIQLQWFIIHS